jgi:hypothetical protein
VAVREASVDLTKTYSISLAIMFLDRLGQPVDVNLIQSLSLRLLAGQSAEGGWTYDCSGIAPGEAARLRQAVNQQNAQPPGKEVPREGPGRREFKDLPPEIKQQLNLIGGAGPGRPGDVSDNSNTQFATLALWVGRRQGIPVEKALARVEARYRGSQRNDGGWPYKNNVGNMPGLPPILGAQAGVNIPSAGSTPSMTCAGLIGLAAGYGIGTETALRTTGATFDPTKLPRNLPDPGADKQVRAALLLLGSMIDNANAAPANGGAGGGKLPAPLPNPAGGRPAAPGAVELPPGGANPPPIRQWAELGKMYYFLWSLERVAVAFGLDTIGDIDWYAWGSQNILQNQKTDGCWGAAYPGDPIDTCFALLFLVKANFASDLTATLKGRVRDPASRELKAGGIGGAELTKNKPDSKPAGKTDSKGPETKPPPATKEPPGAIPPSRASDPEAARLSDELVKAPETQMEQVLEKLRDSKGGVYTLALADAIPRLTGPVKNKAREALAERLTRMTAATLKDKMDDDDPEIRRAAALACAMKEEKSAIPRLIELLQDKEPAVMRAAHASLKSLTGEDFGPAEGNPAELKRAMDAWKAWWASHQPGK